jgi:MoxR-like ATPase
MESETQEDIIGGANATRSNAVKIIDEIHHGIVGKDSLIYNMLIALLAEGNVMLEGLPGVAKTTIAKTFASVMGMEFKRVQFTPDIMPTDVIGACILNQKTMEFEVHQGPVFTNILLVDEINRASPKVQSSLLEAMEEKQVSIEGTSINLPDPFMVITTLNPVDILGTFPLPEAQIDRFMFRLNVDYPTFDEELELLHFKSRGQVPAHGMMTKDEVSGMISSIRQVYVDEKVLKYIRDLVMATRANKKLILGASPRASISLLKASRAVAALNGRDYVILDDVKYLIPHVMNHRLVIKPEYEPEGVTVNDIVDELMASVKVPT